MAKDKSTKSVEELRKNDVKTLNEELILANKNSFKINFEVNSGSEKDISKKKKAKRYIARVKTVLKEKTEESKSTENK